MSSANTGDSLSMSELGGSLPGEGKGPTKASKDLTGQILESLPPNVRKRVTVLQQVQSQHDELEKKFFEERAALEARYLRLYEPLYKQRYEIVNGVTEVEGVTDGTESKASNEDGEGKGVPQFWLSAMKTNETLSMQITERDEDALRFLKDVKWSKIDDPKGFKLEFFFNTNPYFKNTVLTKTYHMIEETEPILERAIGTDIEWNPGKNLTQKVLRKKPKKGESNAKPITKTEPCESFFNFFSPPQVPEDDEDIDQEMAEELQDMMEQDYEIGSTIRDKIIPHAVSWFTGEAVQGEEDIGEEEGDSEDIEEEDDDEDDDEDEDEEDNDDGDDVKGQKRL